MCSKQNSSLFRTVTFRLTLWYAMLFGALSLVVFLAVYVALTASFAQRTDEDLLSTANEFEALYGGQGIEALQAEFRREAQSRGVGRIFFRLLSPQHEVRAASDLTAWGQLNTIPHLPTEPSSQNATFKTISLPGHRYKVRTILKKTTDGHIIQIGTTLEANETMMARYREIFAAAFMAISLIGSIVGWVVARRAMSGVERVTQTAIRIGKGDLQRRVPLGREGEEIENLAWAFNEMLEQIQSLVRELKAVTDNIAHDLRSPVTRIRGIAETTLTGNQELAAYREMAEAVVEESDRLVGMINTMLEIAQTNSGVAALSKTTVDLQKVVGDAGELFLPVAEDKGIRLELELPDEPITVIGDLARLQRMVANLLDNAIKYTDADGTVLLKCSATPSEVVVAIVDSGVGITPRDLPHVFDRFYRGDRSRSAPGSGLGLSLARAIARAHGGDITVVSSPGDGSTFTVRLPRAGCMKITKK